MNYLKEKIYKIILQYYRYLKPIIHFLLPKSLQELMLKDFKKNVSPRLNDKLLHIKLDQSVNRSLPSGVNIIGFVRNIFGLSQQAFTIYDSLYSSHIPAKYFDVSYLSQAETLFNLEIEKNILVENPYNCNLFSINSDLFLPFYLDRGKRFFEGRYNIHYGAWELETYPKAWKSTEGLTREFWAMSRFVQQSVQQTLSIPVLFMPYAIDFKIPTHFQRKDFSLPENMFLFMFSYDMASKNTRKNPQAVLKAFLHAFPYEKNTGLVIKVIRNKTRVSHLEELQNLQSIIQNDKRIFIVDKVLSDTEMRGLINLCHVYVSLHRSEGFGRGMADAMKMGKAVIATNYSGNTDFTTPDTACMVDYSLIEVNPDDYVHYEPGQIWADPYIEHASSYMKKLFEDSEFYRIKSLLGKEFIDTHYNHHVTGNRFRSRLKEIGVIH